MAYMVEGPKDSGRVLLLRGWHVVEYITEGF